MPPCVTIGRFALIRHLSRTSVVMRVLDEPLDDGRREDS